MRIEDNEAVTEFNGQTEQLWMDGFSLIRNWKIKLTDNVNYYLSRV